MQEITLILHNIRSSENVGSLFRTADAAGVSRVVLSGYTPGPLDRFGRANAKLAKAALGAEKCVAYEQVEDLHACIKKLKEAGVAVLALEQDPRSVPYDTDTPKTPVALIVGNEVEGVAKDVLDLADAILEIPMRGKKESLNVAVAGGIALYQLSR